MPHILRLPGRPSLSSFRLAKLQRSVRSAVPDSVSVAARFCHFVALERALEPSEQTILNRILDYGLNDSHIIEHGVLLLVTPRLGTISPWSTKATDIARRCGLSAVTRIERGVAYFVATHAYTDAAPVYARVAPLIHDRMTETVLPSLDSADALFRQFAPQPLTNVEVLRGGRARLERANRDMGLALAPDEIDYLHAHILRLKRDPTDVELMMFAQANSEHCRHKIFNARLDHRRRAASPVAI